MSRDRLFTEQDSRNNQVNYVTVRIWRMSASLECVGHVSLKTPNHYISLWPEESENSREAAKTRKINGGVMGMFMVAGNLKTCVEQDEVAEGRIADVKINLYGLDIAKIEKTFLEFKNSNLKWGLLADNEFLSWYFQYNNCYNCSGLIFALLEKGGISEFVDPRSLFPLKETVKTGTKVGIGVGLGIFATTAATTGASGYLATQGATIGTLLLGPVGTVIGGTIGAAIPYVVGGGAAGCTISAGGRLLVGLRHLSLTPDDIAKLCIKTYYEGRVQGIHTEENEYNDIDDEWNAFINIHGRGFKK